MPEGLKRASVSPDPAISSTGWPILQFVAIRWSNKAVVDIENTYRNPFNRSHIMNIAKNMEAIFFAAIALIGATSFATASAPATEPAFEGKMQVVTVSAKRLTAAEKAAFAQ
jgi:hypothetical protein